jgi:hypothetical protein
MSAGDGGSAAKLVPTVKHPETWVQQEQGQRVVDVSRRVSAVEGAAEQAVKRRLRVALPPVLVLALMMAMVLPSASDPLLPLHHCPCEQLDGHSLSLSRSMCAGAM